MRVKSPMDGGFNSIPHIEHSGIRISPKLYQISKILLLSGKETEGRIITSKQQLQLTYRVNKMFTRTPFISQCESICHLFVVAQTKNDFLSIAKKTCFSVRYENDANVNSLHIYFSPRDIKKAHKAFGSSNNKTQYKL